MWGRASIINGNLYCGSHGRGQLLEHMKLVHGGRKCYCGQYGCGYYPRRPAPQVYDSWSGISLMPSKPDMQSAQSKKPQKSIISEAF